MCGGRPVFQPLFLLALALPCTIAALPPCTFLRQVQPVLAASHCICCWDWYQTATYEACGSYLSHCFQQCMLDS